jgi:hypothetical protein
LNVAAGRAAFCRPLQYFFAVYDFGQSATSDFEFRSVFAENDKAERRWR